MAEQGPKQRGRKPLASRRVLLIGGAVLLVAVVAAVIAAVVASGGSSGSKADTAPAAPPARPLPQAAEVQALLRGIPQRGDVLGSPKAPVTMVEYLDLQCPFCGLFDRYSTPELVARYVRRGKLRLQVRPLGSLGPDSQRGRLAVIAAGRQDKGFQLEHLLFLNQRQENSGWLDNRMIRRAAASIRGLDVRRFQRDRDAVDVTNQGGRYDTFMAADHVKVTPTFLVGKTGGKLKQVEASNPSDPTTLIDAIEAGLGR